MKVDVILTDSTLVMKAEEGRGQKVIPYAAIKKIVYATDIRDVKFSDIWLVGIFAWRGRDQHFLQIEGKPGPDNQPEIILLQVPNYTRCLREVFLSMVELRSRLKLTYPGFD